MISKRAQKVIYDNVTNHVTIKILKIHCWVSYSWITLLPLPLPSLTLSLGLLMFRTVAHVQTSTYTGRNLSLHLETVTNIVKHEKTCSFCQKPEYLPVLAFSNCTITWY